jgi:hypothetical protein
MTTTTMTMKKKKGQKKEIRKQGNFLHGFKSVPLLIQIIYEAKMCFAISATF